MSQTNWRRKLILHNWDSCNNPLQFIIKIFQTPKIFPAMNTTTLPKFIPIQLLYRTQNMKKHLRTFELTNNTSFTQSNHCYTFGFLQHIVLRDLSKSTCHSPCEEGTPCISSVCKNLLRILSKTSKPQNKLHRSLSNAEKNLTKNHI